MVLRHHASMMGVASDHAPRANTVGGAFYLGHARWLGRVPEATLAGTSVVAPALTTHARMMSKSRHQWERGSGAGIGESRGRKWDQKCVY